MTYKQATELAYQLGFPRDENFVPCEFFRSSTADRFDIKNIPTAKEWRAIIRLVKQVLIPLRKKYGHQIIVSSGFRCEYLNKLVGGAQNSYHLHGRAADIYAADLYQLALCLEDIPVSEKIVHKTYIHVAL